MQRVGDTYCWGGQEAVQLHGGVGFTWEYDPQLHFKRAQAASHWLGTAETLREQIAASLLTSDAQAEVVPHKDNADADEAFRDDVASRMREHRSEEQTSELQSLMRISYAVFCLKKKIDKMKTRDSM